jgi:hypothetical protein
VTGSQSASQFIVLKDQYKPLVGKEIVIYSVSNILEGASATSELLGQEQIRTLTSLFNFTGSVQSTASVAQR